MKRVILALLLITLPGAALAAQGFVTYTPQPTQTVTPTPGPTGTAIPGLCSIEMVLSGQCGTPTVTPFVPTAWPTLTPALNLTPQPTPTIIGRIGLEPGDSFDPPDYPDFLPDSLNLHPEGFDALSDANITIMIGYFMQVALAFWAWLAVNFPALIYGLRWFVIIMTVLYGIFMWWRGQKFVPPDLLERQGIDPEAYYQRTWWQSFRAGGSFYYRTRGYRDGTVRRRLDEEDARRMRGERRRELARTRATISLIDRDFVRGERDRRNVARSVDRLLGSVEREQMAERINRLRRRRVRR